MKPKAKLIKRIRIVTVQAKVSLDLDSCPKCGGVLSFFLDCPFGNGNIIIPEICAEKCHIKCEALVYCEDCDYEEFMELFPRAEVPIKKGLEEKDAI